VLVDEQTHQLGDGDRGVCVVQLNREFLVEALEWNLLSFENAQHVLQRARDEEVLLLEP